MSLCTVCSAAFIPGNLFCDSCGAAQSDGKVARKLRQTSHTDIRKATGGLLSVGERLRFRFQTYLVEEAIARSGFGATFRALDERNNRQVLIKQMLNQSSIDLFRDEIMASFKREAKFIRRVRHPSFPKGFQYFERNKCIYLVMEFINGKDLTKALADYKKEHQQIPDGMLVYLGMEIAEALDIIHSEGYLYRDLKPDNVMLDGVSGKVKLIDFGTLYRYDDVKPLLFESEGYTPPEFKDSTKKFTAAGDIYSLGALLYEAATGETPKAPGATLQGRDPQLAAIINKCLKQDPEQRYPKAYTVFKEFRRLTRMGMWPFTHKNRIAPVELSVLPKTLFPSQCTFCEFCGQSDATTDLGYCTKCRVPLRVGMLQWKNNDQLKEFVLYSDETTMGKTKECHISIPVPKDNEDEICPLHCRIFRQGGNFWLETITKKGTTILNDRRIIGPIELLDGDTVRIGSIDLQYILKYAC